MAPQLTHTIGLLLARSALVDEARQHLLAGARLALQQHRHERLDAHAHRAEDDLGADVDLGPPHALLVEEHAVLRSEILDDDPPPDELEPRVLARERGVIDAQSPRGSAAEDQRGANMKRGDLGAARVLNYEGDQRAGVTRARRGYVGREGLGAASVCAVIGGGWTWSGTRAIVSATPPRYKQQSLAPSANSCRQALARDPLPRLTLGFSRGEATASDGSRCNRVRIPRNPGALTLRVAGSAPRGMA
jgi:hypothetical protein